jgi:hypothetical protein
MAEPVGLAPTLACEPQVADRDSATMTPPAAPETGATVEANSPPATASAPATAASQSGTHSAAALPGGHRTPHVPDPAKGPALGGPLQHPMALRSSGGSVSGRPLSLFPRSRTPPMAARGASAFAAAPPILLTHPSASYPNRYDMLVTGCLEAQAVVVWERGVRSEWLGGVSCEGRMLAANDRRGCCWPCVFPACM